MYELFFSYEIFYVIFMCFSWKKKILAGYWYRSICSRIQCQYWTRKEYYCVISTCKPTPVCGPFTPLGFKKGKTNAHRGRNVKNSYFQCLFTYNSVILRTHKLWIRHVTQQAIHVWLPFLCHSQLVSSGLLSGFKTGRSEQWNRSGAGDLGVFFAFF